MPDLIDNHTASIPEAPSAETYDIVFAPSRASPMPPGKTLAVTLKFNLPLAYLEAYWSTGSKLEWACAEVQACALAGSLAKELVQQLAREGLPSAAL